MTDKELESAPNTPPVQEDDDEQFATNYALAIALGLPFGMLFGLLVLDNIAYGLLAGAALAPIIALFMSRRNQQ